MNGDIGPGVWVEALRDGRLSGAVKGSIYKVRDVSAHVRGCDVSGRRHRGISLYELAPRYWAECCYRPIYRPKADLIADLKRPLEMLEAVDA